MQKVARYGFRFHGTYSPVGKTDLAQTNENVYVPVVSAMQTMLQYMLLIPTSTSVSQVFTKLSPLESG